MMKRTLCLLLALLAVTGLCAPARAGEAPAKESAPAGVVSAAAEERLSAPKNIKLANTAEGLKISWGKVAGAAGYRVFYKNSRGNWSKLGDTASTSYVWPKAKSGTAYTLTVRCVSEDGKHYTSDYDPEGRSITYIAAPKKIKLTSTAEGLKISWSKVTGAAGYRVFYKNSKGSWSKLGDTASTSYTWAKAKSGTAYTVTVRCLSKDGKSYAGGYDPEGVSGAFLSAPKKIKLTSAAEGLKISWGKVAGAAKYRVFYKNSKGGWSKVGDTESTSYVWTKAKSGTEYTLTVRCLSEDGKSYTSGYDPEGESIAYIAAPKNIKLANTADGIKISWGKVSGAAGYRVFYKNSKGNWSKLGDTESTSYTWTKAKSGTEYTLTVRCLSEDGKGYAGGYDAEGRSILRLAVPAVKVSNTVNGLKVTWNKVAGADSYRLYFRAKGSGSWNLLGDITPTSFIWDDAVLGMSYAFAVQAVGEGVTGAYESSGYVRYTGAAASPTDI